MSFHEIEGNLAQSFRILAADRARGDVAEFSGVSIASLGAAFQMFNAAFLSAPVESPEAMEQRLEIARRFFLERQLGWSFWICEDWLAHSVRRRLSRLCADFGLRLVSEMPGMIAETICPPKRPMPVLDYRRADSITVLQDFRAIGSTCFHVPIAWFTEVFDDRFGERRDFVCWTGYSDGVPITTAATVAWNGVVGLYNVATLPEFRSHGYGEAITRFALDRAVDGIANPRIVLQSTSLGLRIYERMGFNTSTRILVYNSIR